MIIRKRRKEYYSIYNLLLQIIQILLEPMFLEVQLLQIIFPQMLHIPILSLFPQMLHKVSLQTSHTNSSVI